MARKPGIIEPKSSKAFFSSSLLSRLSLLVSYFLKTFLSDPPAGVEELFHGPCYGDLEDGGLGKIFKNLKFLCGLSLGY